MSDYVDRASEADFALDADTVDGYHAQDLIDLIDALEARVAELEAEKQSAFAALAKLDRRLHKETYEALRAEVQSPPDAEGDE